VTKSKGHSKRSERPHVEELFIRATEEEEIENLRSAFRLCLAAATAGDTSCQLNLGNFYDAGTGVRRNRKSALYWYKRAFRRGEGSAANNIGVLWRNEEKPKRALEWFKKSVRLGNEEANLEIARYYLQGEPNPVKAIRYLKRVLRSNCVTEAGLEEATKSIKQAKRDLKRC
jgi:TPR repeat protein